MSYKIKLDIFEGPLDLLLYLIKKEDLDICQISITQVTGQYLEYIELMKMLDLEIIGDFLVMAATLIQIKSKMLLPPDPNEQPPEEDPSVELISRLSEYKKFKEIAEELKEKESFRQDLFGRAVDEERVKELREDAKEVYFEANLFDLITAFTKALRKVSDNVAYEVRKEEFTVEQKIHDILHLLLEKNQILIIDLFDKARTKMEVVVTFMAVLELIRLKEILVVQKRIFGEIEVMRNKDNVLPVDASEEDKETQNVEAIEVIPESYENKEESV